MLEASRILHVQDNRARCRRTEDLAAAQRAQKRGTLPVAFRIQPAGDALRDCQDMKQICSGGGTCCRSDAGGVEGDEQLSGVLLGQLQRRRREREDEDRGTRGEEWKDVGVSSAFDRLVFPSDHVAAIGGVGGEERSWPRFFRTRL